MNLSEAIGSTPALAISLDTTGSMYPVLEQVRLSFQELVKNLCRDLPGLKIACIAHGDYCDGDQKLAVLDFTPDGDAVLDFLKNTPATAGGDAPECYELALHAANRLSWPESGGTLLLTGDETPHEPHDNPDRLDWHAELAELKTRHVRVIPVQCLYAEGAPRNNFYAAVGEAFDTPLLRLDNFQVAMQTMAAAAVADLNPKALAFYDTGDARNNLALNNYAARKMR